MPLRSTMHSTDASGRMMKYAYELSAFGIQYVPRTAIKAQALVDFLSELTGSELVDSRSLLPDFMLEGEEWIAHVDGIKTQFGGGAGIVLQAPSGAKFFYTVKLNYLLINNEAEYKAPITALQLARAMGIT